MICLISSLLIIFSSLLTTEHTEKFITDHRATANIFTYNTSERQTEGIRAA